MKKRIIDRDAYGHEVYDFHRGQGGYEIVERDDGHVDISGGPAAYFAEFRTWSPHEKAAMKYVTGRVLDVGCGAGRVALHLQKKGHRVTGIDTAPLAARVCRLRGVKNVRVLPLAQVGPSLGTFDTIVMMGNNFGLFGSQRMAHRLLKRLDRITSPDARIVAETLDPYRTTNESHLRYQAFNRSRGRMSGQVRIRIRYQAHISPWFDYLFVSPNELRALLKGTGWKVSRLLASGGPTYIAVLKKIATR
ncbi:MAG: methyltransferase domain-containing protein [bacterium]